MVTTQVLRR